MNATLRNVRFIGGPFDGLDFTRSDFPIRETLRMPVSSDRVRRIDTVGEERAGYTCTAYRLASSRAIVTDGRPTIELRYDFVGFEVLEAVSDSSQSASPHWLSAILQWTRSIPRKFGDWMLEPIDYPLKVSQR
jgi:hypothetical protein